MAAARHHSGSGRYHSRLRPGGNEVVTSDIYNFRFVNEFRKQEHCLQMHRPAPHGILLWRLQSSRVQTSNARMFFFRDPTISLFRHVLRRDKKVAAMDGNEAPLVEMRLQLQRLKSHGARHHVLQAGHRKDAVDGAIEILSRDATRWIETLSVASPAVEFTRTTDAWLIETLIHGAWVREYQEWERATKDYFNEQHRLNGAPDPEWKNRQGWSHVDFVREELATFSINLSPHILFIVERNRDYFNSAMRNGEYFADEQQLRELHDAIADFWTELASAEEYVPEA